MFKPTPLFGKMSHECQGIRCTSNLLITIQASFEKNHQSKMYELHVTPQETTNYNVSFAKRLFYAD